MAIITDVGSPQAASTNISLVLNYDESHPSGADGVQLRCVLRRFDPDVDPETVELDTACDPQGEGWGAKKTTLSAEIRVTPEVWLLLKPFETSDVTVATLPDHTAAVSASNIEESGTVRFPQLKPMAYYAKAENQTVILDLPVVGGELDYTVDPLAAVFTHPNGPAI